MGILKLFDKFMFMLKFMSLNSIHDEVTTRVVQKCCFNGKVLTQSAWSCFYLVNSSKNECTIN